jgi:uncharacterized membrane protein YfcA
LLAPKPILIVLLGTAATAFVAFWIGRARGTPGWRRPTWRQLAIGFVTNFFDMLGIGSFAPTTALYKLGRVVPDENIPGTLNVGHLIPTFVEAVISILVIAVDVEPRTLILLIAASVAGAWLGAGVVAGWSRRRIQLGMGVLLLGAVAVMIARQTGLVPSGGEALGLSGTRLAIGIACNFVLGAFMTLGVGLFAPCMIMVALLGMQETAAFPIMMGSCAFLMPAASVRFVRSGRYDPRASLGLTVAGAPAVLLAAFVVKSLALRTVKWLVVVVVVYTAVAMLRSSVRERRSG